MLKSLRIEGFRSCVNTQLPLEHAVSALVGRNGVGKTNILQAIQWLSRNAVKAEPIEDHQSAFDPSPTSFEAELALGPKSYTYELTVQRDRLDRIVEKLRYQDGES